jgi:hypothetical protein
VRAHVANPHVISAVVRSQIMQQQGKQKVDIRHSAVCCTVHCVVGAAVANTHTAGGVCVTDLPEGQQHAF